MSPGSQECGQCGQGLAGMTEAFDPLELSFSGAASIQPKYPMPHLTITKGPSTGEVFFLEDFPLTLGRDPDCDIFLNNRTVSRQHAILEREGDHIMVRDNHSLNGTWVDGEIIDSAELLDGTMLQVGTFLMRFSR